jgi:hypothetical protein
VATSPTGGVAVTLEFALLGYGVSYVTLMVVMIVQGGRTEGGLIASLGASLPVLLLAGIGRAAWMGDVIVGYVLVGVWLNVSLLVGTRGKPFRALVNSADLARVRGFGPDRGDEVTIPRYVRSPVRWPALTMFSVGAGLLTALRPDWFGLS